MVIDFFDIEQCHIVAHDLGGPPSLHLAYKRRDVIRSLAMVETPFFGVDVPNSVDLASHYWHLNMFQDVDISTTLLANNLDTFLPHFFDTNGWVPEIIPSQLIENYCKSMKKPGALRGSLMHYAAIPTSAGQLAELSKDKLLIPMIGIGSEKVMGEYCGQAVKQLSDDSYSAVIKQCGHWIPEEKPGLLVDQLCDFWRTTGL
jgi:pimeloyl-ACP methyl ester carboxylesterase